MSLTHLLRSRTVLSAVLLAAVAVQAQAGVGTYVFNNSLSAVEGGAPSLSAVDPLEANAFGTASIYGASHAVYNTSGATGAGNNAGLSLNAGSLLTTSQYSLEMVVSLTDTTSGNGYKKLADVSNRASDSGYYVQNSRLDVYNVQRGSIPVEANTYNYLVLTVSNDVVKGYVNGALDFTLNTNVMDFGTYGTAVGTFNFFLDDAATNFGEYSNVSVGLLRLRDSVLTDQQVATLAANPYATVPTPEPTTFAALGLGAVMILRRRQRS